MAKSEDEQEVPPPPPGDRHQEDERKRKALEEDETKKGNDGDGAKKDTERLYHLRPVEGKGLKPVLLHESEPRVIGRSAHLGILDEEIHKNQLECKMTFSPAIAVELKANCAVYVKDRFGVLKMLKPNFVGYLKLGEVLYLNASNSVPKYGYVLTKGLPVMRKDSGGSGAKAEDVTPNDSAAKDKSGTSGVGASNTEDVIDLLDDESSDDDVDGTTSHPRGSAPAGVAGGTPCADGGGAPASKKGDSQPQVKVNDAATQDTMGAKGTADDPCEILSSDEEEEDDVVLRHTFSERGAGSRGRGRQGSWGNEPTNRGATGAHGGRGIGRPSQQPQQSKRDAQRSSNAQQQQQQQQQQRHQQQQQQQQHQQQQQQQPRQWGERHQQAQQQQYPQDAGPSGHSFGHQYTAEVVAPMPQPPNPSHPDDTPAVLASRATLMTAWRAACAAQKLCNELEQSLQVKQAEYHQIIQQAPSGFPDKRNFLARQQYNTRVNHATAAVHDVLTRYNTARVAAGVAAAQHKRTCEELDAALTIMERERRSSAQQRKGEAIASEFQAEVKAWDLVERTTDLNIFPAGELKRIAMAIGVDITGCVEKSELTTAINAKREGGREAWVARKRKRAAEEEIATRQRRKLAELRADESKRLADETAQVNAKQRAVTQVATWALGADLRLFLQRCGISVDAGAGVTKKALTTSYRRAMMRFHPDRTRSASMEQQALAAEVTKWITQAWQCLRD